MLLDWPTIITAVGQRPCRCAQHVIPDLDWVKAEDAHGRQDFEISIEGEVPDIGVTEADIANADPRFEFEEEVDQEVVNTEIVDDNQSVDIVVIDGLQPREVTTSGNEERKE